MKKKWPYIAIVGIWISVGISGMPEAALIGAFATFAVAVAALD